LKIETMSMAEVRGRLRELADIHGISELKLIADRIVRKHRKPRASVKGIPFTEELGESIRDYVARHPDALYHEVATRFGVNQGHVSQAINGTRSWAA
jgi:hypothetical protein